MDAQSILIAIRKQNGISVLRCANFSKYADNFLAITRFMCQAGFMPIVPYTN